MWSDTIGNEDYFSDLLQQENMFLNPELTPGAAEYMERLIGDGFNIKILTSPQWNPYCTNEKMAWIRKHLPFFDLGNLMLSNQKWPMACKNRILLDDNTGHLREWYKYGGFPVAYAHNWNEGFPIRVDSHEEFYHLVHDLETLPNTELSKIREFIAVRLAELEFPLDRKAV